jgi:hypothetical protein
MLINCELHLGKTKSIMQKIYSTVLLLLFCQLTFGQISLTSTMAPPVNSIFLYHDANVPSPAFTFSKSGINNSWDFSGLFASPADEDSVFFVDPADYPAAVAFPTATYGTYEGGDQEINMISIDASYQTALGIIGDPLFSGTMGALVGTPPITRMTFPWTYGSSSSGLSYVEIMTTGATVGAPFDSVRYRRFIGVNATVLAAGDIIIPSGTFPSLLERCINSSVDTMWGKSAATGNMWVLANNPQEIIDSSFYWYSDQSLQPYAHALFDDSGVMHDVNYYNSQLSTAVRNDIPASQLNVFPNPTRDFLGVKGLDFPADSKWSIYNISGQELLKGNFSLNTINVQNLSQGSYILHLTTPEGVKHDVQFIKY